jgi:hypothetical protein
MDIPKLYSNTEPLIGLQHWWDEWECSYTHTVSAHRYSQANPNSLGAPSLRNDIIDALIIVDTDYGLLRQHFRAQNEDQEGYSNDITTMRRYSFDDIEFRGLISGMDRHVADLEGLFEMPLSGLKREKGLDNWKLGILKREDEPRNGRGPGGTSMMFGIARREDRKRPRSSETTARS